MLFGSPAWAAPAAAARWIGGGADACDLHGRSADRFDRLNLDPLQQTDWLLMVLALVARGKTVLSVLHEISLALQADERVVMEKGRVMHQGGSADAATHYALKPVFDLRSAIHCLTGQWVALSRL